jgi:DNA-binding response OmpR family regulator
MSQVLIIDDEPSIASMVAATLERAGLRACVATGLQRALAAATSEWPDMVLLDLTLGGERDGWEVWNRLAEVADGRRLNVIVFAAELSEHDRAEADRRGAAGVLRKTSTPRQLVELVRRALL